MLAKTISNLIAECGKVTNVEPIEKKQQRLRALTNLHLVSTINKARKAITQYKINLDVLSLKIDNKNLNILKSEVLEKLAQFKDQYPTTDPIVLNLDEETKGNMEAQLKDISEKAEKVYGNLRGQMEKAISALRNEINHLKQVLSIPDIANPLKKTGKFDKLMIAIKECEAVLSILLKQSTLGIDVESIKKRWHRSDKIRKDYAQKLSYLELQKKYGLSDEGIRFVRSLVEGKSIKLSEIDIDSVASIKKMASLCEKISLKLVR